MESAAELKVKGAEAFKARNYEEAKTFFQSAIASGHNETLNLLNNIGLCCQKLE